MKKSKETFKVYEGEIKNMNTRALELSQMKKQLLQAEGGSNAGKKGKKKGGAQVVVESVSKEAETERIIHEWNAEKEALAKEREEIMAMTT